MWATFWASLANPQAAQAGQHAWQAHMLGSIQAAMPCCHSLAQWRAATSSRWMRRLPPVGLPPGSHAPLPQKYELKQRKKPAHAAKGDIHC